MSVDSKVANKAVQDKFEPQIKTAEAKLGTLKAHAETAKADFQIKAIAALQPKKQAIEQRFQELKAAGGERWQQVKADLEKRIADFEKSLRELESKMKTKAS